MERQKIKIEALKDNYYKSIETGLEYNIEFKERKKMIADRLKELRTEKNFTQEEVAKKISINRTTYAGYEAERTEPNAEILARLAILYDVSMDYLCNLTNNRYGRYAVEEEKKEASEITEEIKDEFRAKVDNMQNQLDTLKKEVENL